jgi:hypothetical protein
MSGDDLPANETVRIITGITGVMHSPEVIEGETSSSGKTISVEATQTRKSYRLDTAEILAGESEYRKSTYFEIYTPKRLQKRQRANRAPGPQAGSNGVTDVDDLPEPTHVPDGETAYPEPGDEPGCSDEKDDDGGEERDNGSEGADVETDPLEMQEWSRADVLAVEGVGELLIVKLQQTRTSPPTTTGANAVDRAGETYKIRVFDGMGAPMLVVKDVAESNGVVMLGEADKFTRSKVTYAGRNMEWLRRHIGGGGDGSGSGDGGGGDDDPDESGDGSSSRREVLADGGGQTALGDF